MAQAQLLELKPLNRDLLAPDGGNWQVELAAPAKTVMTDFRERHMVSVETTAQVDVALEVMKHAHTRSAFVVDAKTSRVVGFITAYDIMGEKPMRYLQAVGCTHRTCSRDDVHVADIMQPMGQWRVLHMAEVERASVGGVLDTLHQAGCTHLCVVESADGAELRLRGVFSAAKLLRLTEASRQRRAPR